MKTIKCLSVVLIAAMLLSSGCADLSIDNPNAPNAERALETPGAMLSGGYLTFWQSVYGNYYGPRVHLDGWADAQTTTNAFGNFWDSANEPRIRINNTLSYVGAPIMEVPWQGLNGSVSSANDIIRAIEDEGLDLGGDTQMYLACAYFLRGISFGYLANIFDKAYIPLEGYDPVNDPQPEFEPYSAVLDQAISDLDQVISIAGSSSFTTSEFFPGMTYSNEDFSALASSFAARFIVSNARTASEDAQTDWQAVYDYASNGVEKDFSVIMNNYEPWGDDYTYLSGLFWYWRVDNRIISLMDPNYPLKYPADMAGEALDHAVSDDARIESEDQYNTRVQARADNGVNGGEGDGNGPPYAEGVDIAYNADMSYFRVARGPELQSTYFYVRYNYQYDEQPSASGPSMVFLEAENDLMLAEAEMKRSGGDKANAITIINNGTRVTRGNLAPLLAGASDEEVQDAIFYERDIELMRTGAGLAFFDLRRRDAMQAGTPLHLPVPASELNTVGEAEYTFGGAGFAGSEGTADGSNSWDTEWNSSKAKNTNYVENASISSPSSVSFTTDRKKVRLQ